ncbi:histidine triad nucleotide-binding protein 3-like [Centruroides sculpturatus]|uniref:histidine triad nucleotide-binding protein 3-like n=1 Tax=Centruroides sculpturatus TaxID=218467 RepID=UPI000C6E98C8|nr:histidine triad nucleotide-binding protein 3-like [Centruroides sculpturatus]
MNEKEANCIFCTIAHKEDDTELLYEDEEFVAFMDIKPATPHHYLIIPKIHIKNVKVLTYEHKELVEKLVNIGTELLENQNVSKDNIR